MPSGPTSVPFDTQRKERQDNGRNPGGLEAFFRTGSKAGIQPAHAAKLKCLLAQLDQAEVAQDMNVPGWRLHLVSGDLAGHWAVWVNGNWRLVFQFEDGNALLVDYRDDH